MSRMSPFTIFKCPDGRLIYVRREAVTVVYDHTPVGTCVIATATTAMPVPYTATEAMEILYGGT